MAHSLSARKRVRQNEKCRIRNHARKSMVKTQIKQFENAFKAGDKTAAAEQYGLAVRKLDKIAATSTIHKRTAARIKSQLAKKLNSLGA